MINCDYLVIGAGKTGIEVVRQLVKKTNKKIILVEKNSLGGAYISNLEYPASIISKNAEEFESTLKIFKNYKSMYKGFFDFRSSLSKELAKKISQKQKDLQKEFQDYNNLQFISGEARFVSPQEVEINSKKERHIIEFSKCIIATGKSLTESSFDKIDGMEKCKKNLLKRENVYLMDDEPDVLGVLGLTSEGLQIAHLYSSLGYKVKIFEKKNVRKCLSYFDKTVLNYTLKKLLCKQVELFFEWDVKKISTAKKYTTLQNSKGEEQKVTHIFVSSEESFVDILDLEKIGISTSPLGIKTDAYGRCVSKKGLCKNIFALGSCNYSVDYFNKSALIKNFLIKEQIISLIGDGDSSKFLSVFGSFGAVQGIKVPIFKAGFSTNTIITVGISELLAFSKYGPQTKTVLIESETLEGFLKVVYRDTDGKIFGVSLAGEYANKFGSLAARAVEESQNYQVFINFIENYLGF